MAWYRVPPTFADVRALDSVNAAADAATITFDASLADYHAVTLGGNRTLALANLNPGRGINLLLTQDATGSRTVTWFAGVRWQGGAAPTLTTAANKTDLVTIRCVAPGVYLGVASLNY